MILVSVLLGSYLKLVPEHIEVGVKVVDKVGNGIIVKGKTDAIPSPHRLIPFTVISPDTAVLLKVTVILFEPNPAVISAPEGNVHSYEIAFGINATLYTCATAPLQAVIGPVIVPAADGLGSTCTFNSDVLLQPPLAEEAKAVI